MKGFGLVLVVVMAVAGMFAVASSSEAHRRDAVNVSPCASGHCPLQQAFLQQAVSQQAVSPVDLVSATASELSEINLTNSCPPPGEVAHIPDIPLHLISNVDRPEACTEVKKIPACGPAEACGRVQACGPVATNAPAESECATSVRKHPLLKFGSVLLGVERRKHRRESRRSACAGGGCSG